MTLIYHMADRDDWDAAMKTGFYPGTAMDQEDGYIHFSTADNIVQSAAKHRAGAKNLLLITVEADALGDLIKWEEARGGILFPHLYDSLKPDQVMKVENLPLGSDGLHTFPPLY